MKKYLALFIFLAFVSAGFSQTFQASIQAVPAEGSVIILVRPSANVTGKVSSLTITIALPTSIGTRPSITVDNSANPYIGYVLANAVDQSIAGVPHYIYNVLGTGDVVPAGATVNFAANTDIPMAEIHFSGGGAAVLSQVKMVNLPDGGTDPNPNSFFGFSIDGTDVPNEAALFYAITGVSTAVNDGNGYSGTSYAQTTGLVPLPVKFLSFDAFKKDGNALLTWTIENESMLTERYDIERSTNGVEFKKFQTINSNYNGSSKNSYNFTDASLSSFRNNGVVYYRIKQFDKDGKFITTAIRNLRLTRKDLILALYPNPVKDYANVTLDLEQDADVKVTINDAAGKQVQTIPMQLFKGLNIKKINLGTLAAGSYMLNVNTGAEIKTIPLVKVN